MIWFERGDVLADKIMQRIRLIGGDTAKDEFGKRGLMALPTKSSIKHLIPRRGHPESSKIYRVITRLRRRGIKPFSLSLKLDDLIQFKDNWKDNPLYPKNIKSTVQHVQIKHIISHQDTVKEKIVKKYKEKPGRDLPILHKIGSKYFVEDGNHRIVAKKLNGESHVRARVFEKDLSCLLDDLIRFQELHQPKKKDEPPKSLPKFTHGELVDYTVQQHEAKRAGTHRDVRIGTKRSGLLSWATRKLPPGHGEKIAIHQQPTHRHVYLGWEGKIPSGYGAGTVRTEDLGKALVTKSTPDELHATLADRKGSHRLAFIKTGKGWLLLKGQSPQPSPEAIKPKARSLSPGKAKDRLLKLEPGTSVQPKIDGALVYVSTGRRPEIFSHRTSKTTGRHVIHTERVFHGRPEIKGNFRNNHTLIGELYGVRKGASIEPQELGGILNSHVGKSILKQKQTGVKLKVMPFDVAGDDRPYAQRLRDVKKAIQHLPGKIFHAPEETNTPSEALKLYQKIRSGHHSLTKEGIIIHPPQGDMIKIKNVEEANVKIHSVFPGKGKYEKSYGGFYYSDKQGRRLGKVGTGFSDETRSHLHDYVGRTARVKYQERFKSGKLRAPSFIAVDEGK